MRSRLFFARLVFGLVALSPALCRALEEPEREAVRLLANQAAMDFEAGHFEDASEKFEEAYRVAPLPRLAVWLARTEQKRGRLLRAVEHCRNALALTPNELWLGTLQHDAQREAAELLQTLSKRLPELVVLVEGLRSETVVVEIDGQVLPRAAVGVARPLDPGTHRIVAIAGKKRVERELVLFEGDRQTTTLSFATPAPKRSSALPLPPAPANGELAAPSHVRPREVPPPGADRVPDEPTRAAPRSQPSPGSSQRTLGWLGVGVGAGGLLVGGGLGLLAMKKSDELSSHCQGRACPPAYFDEVDELSRLRTWSTVGILSGFLAGAGGLTLWLTAPSDGTTPELGLLCLPTGAMATGRF